MYLMERVKKKRKVHTSCFTLRTILSSFDIAALCISPHIRIVESVDAVPEWCTCGMPLCICTPPPTEKRDVVPVAALLGTSYLDFVVFADHDHAKPFILSGKDIVVEDTTSPALLFDAVIAAPAG